MVTFVDMVDVRTGELLAVASLRTRHGRTSAGIDISSAIVEILNEPGSTSKLFSVAAILRSGTDTTPVNGEGGHWLQPVTNTYKRTIDDVHKLSGPVTLGETVKYSSNIAITKFSSASWSRSSNTRRSAISIRLGRRDLRLSRRGASRNFRRPAIWENRILSQGSLAQGYEWEASAVQIAVGYAAIANDGVLMAPTLLREVCDEHGNVLWRHRPDTVRRAVPDSIARHLNEYLTMTEGDGGTGSKAQLDLAQGSGEDRHRAKVKTGGLPRIKFVGIFPAESPQMVVYVMTAIARPAESSSVATWLPLLCGTSCSRHFLQRGVPLDRGWVTTKPLRCSPRRRGAVVESASVRRVSVPGHPATSSIAQRVAVPSVVGERDAPGGARPAAGRIPDSPRWSRSARAKHRSRSGRFAGARRRRHGLRRLGAMNIQLLIKALRRQDLIVSAPTIDMDVDQIEVDSRRVKPGSLFVAVRGSVDDGHKFIPAALAAGAAALLTEQPVEAAVPVIVVRDGRRAAQVVAETWYDRPARLMQLVGITGTNGKTTTTAMMRHLLNRDGDAGSIGTLGAFDAAGDPVKSSAGTLTTPGPLDLQATFRGLYDRGVRHVAMETSSHALDQGRLDGLTFAAGIFTNVTREHLDYHGTMEHYLAAKLRLADLVASDGVLSVNADDPAWETLRSDRRTIAWGVASDADVTVQDAVYRQAGSRFALGGRFGTRDVSIPFLGEFNVANAVGAATGALGLGEPIDDVVERLATAPQVPGRMERLADSPFTVLRDYAHTPDAYQRVFSMLRPLVSGRLYILFGCGGERDSGKRPIMGQIAAEYADRVIVTSDNPRRENPEKIMDDIVAGMPPGSYDRIFDREEAIAHALQLAKPGDMVLLVGKGHETYQIEGTTKRHFDEREIVQSLLS